MQILEAKHNEGIPKHTQKTVREHRTTIRVFSDEWQIFMESCHQYGLTTCYVLRCFIHQWIGDLRAKSDILKIARKDQAGLYDDTNIQKKGGEKWQWIYHKDSMAIYRYPASMVFVPGSSDLRFLPPNYLRGRVTNL